MMAISHRADHFRLVPPSEQAAKMEGHRLKLKQLIGKEEMVTRAMCDEIRTELKVLTMCYSS